MEYVFYLDWADKSKNDLMGRRGELLNIALEKEVRIQRTAVVNRKAFQSFLLESGIREEVYSLAEAADHTSSEDLRNTHREIRQKIMNAELPWDMEMELTSLVKGLGKESKLKTPYLMLYPSFGEMPGSPSGEAPLAWSLHPGGEPRCGLKSLKEFVTALRSVWVDFFGPEAVRFRRKRGIKDDAAYPAVLVQTLSNAKQSGLYLSHMNRSSRKEKGVSAIYGLIPAIYEEEPVPDIYAVDIKTWNVVSKEVNKQAWRYGISEEGEVIKYRVGESRQENQKIDDGQIIRVCRTGLALEPAMDGVLRMAWTLVEDELVVTDCREMSEDEMDQGMKTAPQAPVKETKPAAAPAGAFDAGFFGGWFGGEAAGADTGDDLDDDPTPTVPTHVVGPVTASTAAPAAAAAAATAPVGPAAVQEVRVVAVDMSDVHLNEEVLGTRLYLDVLTPEDVKRVEKGYYNGAFVLTERFFTKSYYGAHPNVLRERKEDKPSLDDLVQRLAALAKVLKPLPLVVKLSDFGAAEYLELEGADQYEITDNKYLNWRGASRYIHPFFRQAFKNEVLAVKAVREAGYTNVHIMLPFVRTPAELVSVKEMVKECGAGPGMKTWLLASCPSNLTYFDEFCEMVDGVLVDYYLLSLIILGLDPGITKPEAVAHILRDQYSLPLYRSVLGPVKDRARRDVEVAVFDIQGLKDPDVLDLLVSHRVDGVVTSSKSILKLYPMMASAERRYLMERIRALSD